LSRGKVVLLLLVLVGLAWGVVASLHVGSVPELKLLAARPGIGRHGPVTASVQTSGRGLNRVTIALVQQDRVRVVAEKAYTPRPAWAFWGPRTLTDSFQLDVGRDSIPDLRPGQATIRITAERAPTWLRSPAPAVQELTLPVRLVPPALYVLSSQHYLGQGGAEVVVYRVGESSVKDGVQAGDWFFRGAALPGGGPQDRFALFACPYDLADAARIRLTAVDDVGNTAEVAFVDKFFPAPIKHATLPVTDAFLAKVVPEILSHTNDIGEKATTLDSFLAINGTLRKKNNGRLKELAADSAQRFLWSQPFLLWRNAQVMSAFADRRTYAYQGREVDHQDHLGFDLATTQQAEVPAANSGTVVLAEYFGIYGNAVVLDHGYGLMSLYGHLSSIAVTPGQQVTKGEAVGRSGQTGLAGGDHLHFTILLQGLPVNPREWWDPHWLRDRIKRKLGGAFVFEE
jgi:murein DD-endopeptidase MepM/ murein hydrolase activator NlpD